MLEERLFKMVRVYTDISLVFTVGFNGCRVEGFACGMNWHAIMASTIIDHYDDVLGDGCFGASKFSLLGGRDIFIFDGHLFHEVLTDGD